jgi:hypothetical protein
MPVSRVPLWERVDLHYGSWDLEGRPISEILKYALEANVLIPDAFFKVGVKAVAGVRILDPDLMIKILKQGGSAYHPP